jgi:hypothetical protein
VDSGKRPAVFSQCKMTRLAQADTLLGDARGSFRGVKRTPQNSAAVAANDAVDGATLRHRSNNNSRRRNHYLRTEGIGEDGST